MDLGHIVQHEGNEDQIGSQRFSVLLVEQSLLVGGPAGDTRVQHLDPGVFVREDLLQLAGERHLDGLAVAKGDRIAEHKNPKYARLLRSDFALPKSVRVVQDKVITDSGPPAAVWLESPQLAFRAGP